jgi:hypothetical protein
MTICCDDWRRPAGSGQAANNGSRGLRRTWRSYPPQIGRLVGAAMLAEPEGERPEQEAHLAQVHAS